MEDARGLFHLKRLADGSGIAEIKSAAIQAYDVTRWRELRRKLDEVIPDESASTGDPDSGLVS